MGVGHFIPSSDLTPTLKIYTQKLWFHKGRVQNGYHVSTYHMHMHMTLQTHYFRQQLLATMYSISLCFIS